MPDGLEVPRCVKRGAALSSMWNEVPRCVWSRGYSRWSDQEIMRQKSSRWSSVVKCIMRSSVVYRGTSLNKKYY